MAAWPHSVTAPSHAVHLPACPTPRPAPCSKVVRKGIARVLTVVNQKTREALKEAYKGKVGGGAD